MSVEDIMEIVNKLIEQTYSKEQFLSQLEKELKELFASNDLNK